MNNRLKSYRKLGGFTQESLATASGISIRTIQRIEKGLSQGSPHTLSVLASTLDVELADILEETPLASSTSKVSNKVKLMNLSALSILLLPLGNIIAPLVLFLRHKEQKEVNLMGRKILSFQILWTVLSILFILTMDVILLVLYEGLRFTAVPVYVPLYILTVAVNMLVTLQIAIKLGKGEEILKKTANIL